MVAIRFGSLTIRAWAPGHSTWPPDQIPISRSNLANRAASPVAYCETFCFQGNPILHWLTSSCYSCNMSVYDRSVDDNTEVMKHMNETHTPLRESSFYILVSISKRPIHGYGIIKDTEQMSNGRVKLSNGTLFGALKRMIEAGWITRNENASKSGREKIEYRITEYGIDVLNAEITRLKSLVKTSQEFSLKLKSN